MGHFSRRAKKVLNQRVDRDFHVIPRAAPLLCTDSLARLSFFAHSLANALQFKRHLFISSNNFIETIGDLARQAGPGHGKADAEIPILHPLQALQNRGHMFKRFGSLGVIAFPKAVLAILARDGLFSH